MNDSFVIHLPSGASFTAKRGEKLLTAAQNARWMIRYGCRNGNCEVCEAQLLQGSVLQHDKLIEATNTLQKILLCQCSALSDLSIALKFDPTPGSADLSRRFYAQLAGIVATNDGAQLEFLLPAGRKPALLAGQYAVVETKTGAQQHAIDNQLTTARKLIVKTNASINLVVGEYYYVRYPFGSGIES